MIKILPSNNKNKHDDQRYFMIDWRITSTSSIWCGEEFCLKAWIFWEKHKKILQGRTNSVQHHSGWNKRNQGRPKGNALLRYWKYEYDPEGRTLSWKNQHSHYNIGLQKRIARSLTEILTTKKVLFSSWFGFGFGLERVLPPPIDFLFNACFEIFNLFMCCLFTSSLFW